MQLSTRTIALSMVGIAIAIAAYFLWDVFSNGSIDDFYSVTDSFTDDAKADESAFVGFVSVKEYDSLKIVRVADRIIDENLSGGKLPASKRRRFLLHFYSPTDTSELTDQMIEELAYTNPEIVDPRSVLRVVNNGYVLRADFPAEGTMPMSSKVSRSQYFMPRTGVRAADVK